MTRPIGSRALDAAASQARELREWFRLFVRKHAGKPGIGFIGELRGSAVGANVISPASSSVIARRMAAKASSISSASSGIGCHIW